MTKEEIQTRLEAAEKQMIGLQDEIENLKAKLCEAQDEEIPEFPTFNGGCSYFVNTHGTVEMLSPDAHGRETDYNGFHTHEYAQLFADKCREIAMLLHCKWYSDRELVTNFADGSTGKWCVWYDHFSNEWSIDSQQTHENTTIYFTTLEAATKACDWMNANAKRGNEHGI